MELGLSGLAGPAWFASARASDLVALPPAAFLTTAELARAGAFKFGQPRENFTLGRLAGKLALERGHLRLRERAADVGGRAQASVLRAVHGAKWRLATESVANQWSARPAWRQHLA